MMQYIYVGMSDLKSMFRYKSSKMAKMSKGGSHSSDIGRGGGHVHTNWDRTLIFGMDISLDLYFHILKKNWGGPPQDPPRGGEPPNPPPEKGWGTRPPLMELGSWFFAWALVWTYIFIIWKVFEVGALWTPPGGKTPRASPKTPPKK